MWQKEAVRLFGSWKASRCDFFIIMKKKVKSIRNTDNDNAGMVGSLKTGGWFG